MSAVNALAPPSDCRVDVFNTFVNVTEFEELDRKKATRRRNATSPAMPVSVIFNELGVLQPVAEGEEVDPEESRRREEQLAFLLSLPNIGSLEHRQGRCMRKRCYWHHTSKGCRKGWLCAHCHYCLPLPMSKARKNPRHLMNKMRRQWYRSKEGSASNENLGSDTGGGPLGQSNSSTDVPGTAPRCCLSDIGRSPEEDRDRERTASEVLGDEPPSPVWSCPEDVSWYGDRHAEAAAAARAADLEDVRYAYLSVSRQQAAAAQAAQHDHGAAGRTGGARGPPLRPCSSSVYTNSGAVLSDGEDSTSRLPPSRSGSRGGAGGLLEFPSYPSRSSGSRQGGYPTPPTGGSPQRVRGGPPPPAAPPVSLQSLLKVLQSQHPHLTLQSSVGGSSSSSLTQEQQSHPSRG
uniref:Uncharacterized protein n=1 Tax=Chromera velia CCMP2878 TaxID=1169474 RepID=A0A0G4G148_9ALVE|eukprot:Cvel_525.t1-p1 / transcript=Cvel_525.t1 / gene=Cvel_525 / organism=Chromera_velia_CCMP2878 / gene_product=hypothetical protein / transcript_product=hypothetical protein / location=Cvel_scaffold16:113360-115005(-) / protein_length=403 / sequence_SO=supercontig / SO=protein_coding / is_pseudo=false